MTYFITLWLQKDDSDDILEQCKSILDEIVSKHCGGKHINSKISSGGKRITIIPLCESQQCNLAKGTINKITDEIKELTGRTVKGKVACNLD